jgi:dihydropteroate synthase
MFPALRAEFDLSAGPFHIALGRRTLVMGVLNCTPDSFSDGGRYLTPEAAVRRLVEIEEEGADLCDIGGESTRPGAEPVTIEEEWNRIKTPLCEARRRGYPLPLSVDTTKAEVARRALDEGAVMINDVSGLQSDPSLAGLAARYSASLVLMHMKGEPRTMQQDPIYADCTAEVTAFLHGASLTAEERGVDRQSIIIDPGIGFGKTVDHNLELIRRLPELAALGFPVLIGASRKSFIGRILDLPVEQRLEGSLAAHVAAALAGAHAVRVHDVAATVRALRVVDAIRGAEAILGTDAIRRP